MDIEPDRTVQDRLIQLEADVQTLREALQGVIDAVTVLAGPNA